MKSQYHEVIISYYHNIIVHSIALIEEGISFFRPKLTTKTVFAFLTPPPRVVEGWNLYVWQWIFEAHMPVTSKPAQLLQNRHFAETLFGFCSKKYQTIFLSQPWKFFQQSACFGEAVQGYTQLSNAARKFIARHIGFSPLRPLAEG